MMSAITFIIIFFFTYYLQGVVMLLVVLCLAFAAQLVVVFVLSCAIANGSPFLVFGYRFLKVENEPK